MGLYPVYKMSLSSKMDSAFLTRELLAKDLISLLSIKN